MNQFKKSKLLMPLTEVLKLEDPDWHTETEVDFYIPVWFNPDKYFEGLNVNTSENEDYINLYLSYNFKTDKYILSFNYANNSGNYGDEDFSVDIINIDVETDKKIRKLINEHMDTLVIHLWEQLEDIAFDPTEETL